MIGCGRTRTSDSSNIHRIWLPNGRGFYLEKSIESKHKLPDDHLCARDARNIGIHSSTDTILRNTLL